MPAPIVALTSTTKDIEGLMRVRLNEAYVSAARAAGLVPLVLPPLDPADLGAVLSTVRGVILTGGEDVDPAEFQADRHPRTQEPHRARDRCELALVRMARERGIPTLAICRGMQVVNVAFGGTLIQDIASECGSAIEHDLGTERTARVHDVTVQAGSSLARALAATELTVNSSHHQAIRRPADGLRVTAHAPDGVIEGAEWGGDDWWMLAVQWHPEELVTDAHPWDRGLFKAFAAQAAR